MYLFGVAVFLFYLFTYLVFYLYIYLSTYLFIYLFIFLFAHNLKVVCKIKGDFLEKNCSCLKLNNLIFFLGFCRSIH